MGELVTEQRFLDRYAARHGKLPLSYYQTRSAEIDGFAPTAGEMGYFLDRGDIWNDYPWKKITYNVPPDKQQEAFEAILELSQDYRYRVTARHGRSDEIIGARAQLISDYADERGRPVVEGILDDLGKVRSIVYKRRRVKVVPVLNRDTDVRVSYKTRRDDFRERS